MKAKLIFTIFTVMFLFMYALCDTEQATVIKEINSKKTEQQAFKVMKDVVIRDATINQIEMDEFLIPLVVREFDNGNLEYEAEMIVIKK